MASTKAIKGVSRQVLERIEPSKEDKDFLKKSVRNFESNLRNKIKEKSLKATFFEGGSFAKGTLMKKSKYDIDLFVRFEKYHANDDLSKLTEEILKDTKNVQKIHGSRDYFKIDISEELEIELVPVLKISKPEEAVNVTDLSYSHVKYVKNNATSQKILDDIKIAKAFCHATKTYGAESYISGFSGYALELLIIYYGSFEKFLKEIVKERKDKIVIDMARHYKNRNEILLDINSSKLNSPVILIDPTYKKRNALAALSKRTFNRFVKESNAFLESPSIESFETRKLVPNRYKTKANQLEHNYVLIELKTDKQEGSIAGSKLQKFHRHLIREISKYFNLEASDFEYDGHKASKAVYMAKPMEKIVFKGPSKTDKENLKIFKSKHKSVFFENERAYAEEKNYSHLEDFFKNWIKNNRDRLKEMNIKEISIKDSN
ncbi:MAG: nucleotidyltransferase domain-containing protein [Candidatus Pacearchaeota archaeon]